jgi:hypothetical protein
VCVCVCVRVCVCGSSAPPLHAEYERKANGAIECGSEGERNDSHARGPGLSVCVRVCVCVCVSGEQKQVEDSAVTLHRASVERCDRLRAELTAEAAKITAAEVGAVFVIVRLKHE